MRSDEQLVALYRKGSEEAFDVIHERYANALLRYTRRMIRQDAEDAVQEVLARAALSLRESENAVTLRPWLYRIAKNRCIDELRRPAPEPEEILELSRTPACDPVTGLERRLAWAELCGDLGRLPAPQRRAIVMCVFEGRPHAEAAVALGISAKAVKSLLMRARQNLREAHEARETTCVEIRADLALAHGRRVRMSGRCKRHVRDCAACRTYKRTLHATRRPDRTSLRCHGPWATIAQLLGLGGAGSGAATAGGGAAIGGATAGGTIAVGAPVTAKLTAMLCCGVALFGVGGPQTQTRSTPGRHPSRGATAPAAARPAATDPQRPDPVLGQMDPRAAAPPVRIARPAAGSPQPAAAHGPATAVLPTRDRQLLGLRDRGGSRTTPYADPADAARRTGGALAGEHAGGAADDPAATDTPAPGAAPRDPDTVAPPATGPASPAPPPAAARSDANPQTPAAPAPPEPAGAGSPAAKPTPEPAAESTSEIAGASGGAAATEAGEPDEETEAVAPARHRASRRSGRVAPESFASPEPGGGRITR